MLPRGDVRAALEEANREKQLERNLGRQRPEAQGVDHEGSHQQPAPITEPVGHRTRNRRCDEPPHHVERHEERREELGDREAFLHQFAQYRNRQRHRRHDGDREHGEAREAPAV